MRTSSFRFFALACLASGVLLTTGCQRNDVQPNEDVTTAEDRSEDNLETAFSADIMTAARPQDGALNNSPAVAGALELRRIYGTCATRTYDAQTRVLTIDFGSVNCLCPDGRYRRGKIVVAFTTDTPTRRAGAIVTRENYFVNDNQHTATRIFTDLSLSSFTVEVPSASIVRANNGGTHSWTASWTFTRTAGFNTAITADDGYSVTGAASGTNRRGTTYTTTIESPLIKRGDCYKYYVAGTVRITNDRSKAMLLNYDPSGSQACDNTATVTINGRTKTITLR
ncbi:hypothetical protein BEN47_04115 [Hymenobacter lapidarius]|uniref:Lipoprotein n=1 Tax=Hymenobacter lapidarius TaxID=1908237 RepID=A0A1G1SVE0_9BACT|nr:hypothetical protein [Hymenobacter lapidarius]OGX82576.1 hypothetical protein BEN47_04115 [Hymenobacter lapidarius]